MKKQIIFVSIFLCCLFVFPSIYAQKIEVNWESFKNYLADNKPKSASILLDKYLKYADNQNDEYLRFRVHFEKTQLLALYDEHHTKTAILYVDSVMQGATAPYANLYHLMMGYCLKTYLYQNRYTLIYRNEVKNENLANLDFWSADNIANLAKEHMLRLTDHPQQLATIPMDTFQFMVDALPQYRYLRPTLLDFLAQSQLFYFENDNKYGLNMEQYDRWDYDELSYYQSDKEHAIKVEQYVRQHFDELIRPDFFLKMDFTQDTLNIPYFSVLQRALLVHAQYAPNQDVSVDYELCKINFLKKYFIPDSLLLTALDNIEAFYGGADLTPLRYERALVYWRLAIQLPQRNTVSQNERLLQQCDSLFQLVSHTSHPVYAVNAQYYLRELHNKLLSLSRMTPLYPGKKLLCPVLYSNIDSVYVTILQPKHPRRTIPLARRKLLNYYKYLDSVQMDMLLSDRFRKVRTDTFRLNSTISMQSLHADIFLDSLPVGDYYLVFHDSPVIDSNNVLSISELKVSIGQVVSTNIHEKKWNMWAFDAWSGEALPRVLFLYPFAIHITNKHGNALFPINNLTQGSFKTAFHKNDVQSCYASTYNYYRRNYHRRYYRDNPCFLFTDRAVYRPGQTVYVKAVITDRKKVLSDAPVTVVLYDDNYRTITTKQLVTNSFGSVNCEFKLPSQALLGNYEVEVRSDKRRYLSNSLSFSVEEYKRPTFEVLLDSIKEEYRLNDSVPISGQVISYTGAPIQGADILVRYEWDGNTANYQTVSDEKGKFDVFIPSKFYSHIQVDATDINGETQSSSQIYLVTPVQSLLLSLRLPEIVNTSFDSTLKMEMTATNGQNNPVNKEVTVTISRLQSPDKYYFLFSQPKPEFPMYTDEEYARYFPEFTFREELCDKTLWKEDLPMISLKTQPGKLQFDPSGWLLGDYVVRAYTVDKYGDTARAISYFQVLNNEQSMPTRESYAVFPESEVQNGQYAHFAFGSCLDDAIAHYELFLSNKLIKVGEVQLKDKQIVTDSIKITDVDYMSELKLNVLVVKCGEVFTHSASCMAVDTLRLYALLKKYGPLKMQWSHYSRLMNPGNKESWRLTVKYSDSTAQIPVEVLACMYDISLDKIIEYPNYNKFPDFSSSFTTKLYGCLDFNNITTEPIYTNHQDASKIYPKMSLKEIRYEKLRYRFSGKDMTKNIESAQGVFSQDGDMTSARGSRFDGETRTLDASTVAYDYDQTTTNSVMVSCAQRTEIDGMMVDEKKSMGTKSEREISEDTPTDSNLKVTPSGQGMAHNNNPSFLLSKVTPRTNFTETAFFYPELYTNERGEVSFEFTAPEQLTRWKFMAWAHTQKLQYGYLSETMVTQRPLMVMPNRPRFLREGDTLLFQVKVTNLNPNNSQGTIRLSWINPETEQPVTNVLLDGAEQSFECNPLSSTVVKWKMTVPSHFPVLKYSVVAVGHDLDNPLQYFSDGEENVLPVLSLKTQIIDAQSFYVHQDSIWSLPLDLSAYSDSAQHQLVVHTHPMWAVYQSLPYLMDYQHNCNEQIYSKLFAEVLAKAFLEQNGTLYRCFLSALKDTANGSPLMQEEMLKNILLSETPWVNEGNRETQYLQRMGQLFKPDMMQQQINRLTYLLERAQKSSGGWGWFDRFNENQFITQHILAGTAHLERLQLSHNFQTSTLTAALRYLHRQSQDKYERFLHDTTKSKKFIFNNLDAQYLYVISYFEKPDWTRTEIGNFYMQEARKSIATASYYTRAQLAMAFYRLGLRQEAESYAQSLVERAYQKNGEMYWTERQRICRYMDWYEVPIETHALLMEAMCEILPDTTDALRQTKAEVLQASKQWLINQRIGNRWETTKATTEACYALLLSNLFLQPKVLPEAMPEVKITYGKQIWTHADTVLSASYALTPATEPLQLQLQNRTTDDIYGSIRHIATLPITGLPRATSNEFGIRKKLYRIDETGGTRTLRELHDGDTLFIGEKVLVRIELIAHRTLEYLHLNDARAAALEPLEQLSRYENAGGLYYYESPTDAGVHFFFGDIQKGNYVLEYELRASQVGSFVNGIATIQSMYVPDFTARSDSQKIVVREKE